MGFVARARLRPNGEGHNIEYFDRKQRFLSAEVVAIFSEDELGLHFRSRIDSIGNIFSPTVQKFLLRFGVGLLILWLTGHFAKQ